MLSLPLVFLQPVQAIPATFSNSVIIDDSDFFSLPSYFSGRDRASSIALIQAFLSQSTSILANTQITLDIPTDWGNPSGSWLSARPYLQQYTGRQVSVAEAVWMISQEDLGRGKYYDENLTKTTNPLYLLALIQKESGLSYGSYANAAYGNQSLQYRIDRMTGYACFESQPDCDVEFRGAFRQMYFGLRDKKAFSDACKVGFAKWNSGRMSNFLGNRTPNYIIGGTITLDGNPITLQTAIACAKYIYTPHDSYSGFYNIMKNIDSRFATISPTISSTNNTSSSSSISSITSTSVAIPAPTPQFTGIQAKQESAFKEVIREIDAPKPAPTPIYTPLFVEINDPIRSNNEFATWIASSAKQGQVPTLALDSLPQVAGIQIQRKPWYENAFVIYFGLFLIFITSILGTYRIVLACLPSKKL